MISQIGVVFVTCVSVQSELESLQKTTIIQTVTDHEDYDITSQLVHTLACTIELWSTREVWRARKKR